MTSRPTAGAPPDVDDSPDTATNDATAHGETGERHADARTGSAHPDEAAGGPTCRCGFGLDHHFVSEKLEYGVRGWLWNFLGVNAMPTRIRFVCRQCGEVLRETTDPDELEAHRMGGR